MPCIAVVGTRCVDGDHAALRRWYADHVHQLMAFDGLRGARLAQRHGAAAGATPEWLCFYTFEDRAAFDTYETSPVKAAAAADRERSWGRSGIEIVHRAPYQRLYRRDAGAASAQGASEFRVTLLEAADARALAAAAGDAIELLSDDGGAVLMLCDDATGPGPPAWQGRMRWSAHYRWQLVWTR